MVIPRKYKFMKGIFLEIPIGEHFSFKTCFSLVVLLGFGLVFFPSSFSAFLPVKSMFLKNNTPCLWAVDSTFMLLIFFCHFFFFLSVVSGLFPQLHTAHRSPHPSLSIFPLIIENSSTSSHAGISCSPHPDTSVPIYF